MYGIWFTAMVAMLVTTGVLAQLGWQLPAKDDFKRVLRLDRLRWGQLRTRPPASAAAVEPR